MNQKAFPHLTLTFEQLETPAHLEAINSWLTRHSIEVEKDFKVRTRILWTSDIVDFTRLLFNRLQDVKYIRVYSLEGFSTAHTKIAYAQADIDQQTKTIDIHVGYTDACRQFGKGNTHVVKFS